MNVRPGYAVHLTMIHQWKKSLLEGAAGIFKRGGEATATAEIAEDMLAGCLHSRRYRPPAIFSKSSWIVNRHLTLCC